MSDILEQHSAGGLVYCRENGRVLVVMTRDRYGKWTFPKGHVEEGETLEQAARREISEEVGIDSESLTLETELGHLDYQFESSFARDLEASGLPADHPPVTIHKTVTYYLFSCQEQQPLTAQEGEVEMAAWVPFETIDETNEYEDNKAIIVKAKSYLA